MEKTLSLGAFEELSENEVMVTEGGFVISATCVVICGVITVVSAATAVGVVAVSGAQAAEARRRANEAERKYIESYGRPPYVG